MVALPDFFWYKNTKLRRSKPLYLLRRICGLDGICIFLQVNVRIVFVFLSIKDMYHLRSLQKSAII